MVAFKRLVLALWILTPFPALAEGVRTDHPNLVGGEILGRGLVVTLNYERFLTNQFGLGGGVMAIATAGETAVVVPLYASYVPGDIHSVYFSAGTAFVGGGEVQNFQSQWLLQASIGYQYHSPTGFFVRPLFAFMTAPNEG